MKEGNRAMGYTKENRDLCEQTKKFALRIIRLVAAMPKITLAQVLGKQVLRSGTSPGAHYREAFRAVHRRIHQQD